MKTVKRKANVGERILITDKVIGSINIGDTGEVTLVDGKVVYANIRNGMRPVYHSEYEVIIEGTNEMPNGIIEQMQAEINELKSKVAALEGKESMREVAGEVYEIMTQDSFIFPKPPQQIRDEIVAKAKADVKELSTTWRAGCASLRFPPSAFDPKTETVNFSVSKNKRTVVCYITYKPALSNSTVTSFRGIAKADPSDCFNVHIGKAIALRRALGLEVPAEYYNAPAPTEARVGDVVEQTLFGKHSGPVHAINPRKRTYNDRDADVIFSSGEGDALTFITNSNVDGGKYEMWAKVRNVKIIDDSRE